MKKNRLLYRIPLIVLFLMLITLPLINQVFEIWQFPRKKENRVFHDSLKIDIELLDDFPKDFNAYVNDNFSFRTPLLEIFNYSKLNLFKVSPNPGKAIFGKDNWFFTSQKDLKIYEGKIDFNQDELSLFKKEWLRRIKYLNAKDIKFCFLIAPMKHYIYSNKLPFSINKNSAVKRSSKLINFLNSEFGNFVIDPTNDLIQNKFKFKSYFQLDNHWNSRGAEIACHQFFDHISKNFPNVSFSVPQFTWTTKTISRGCHFDVANVKTLAEDVEYPNLSQLNAKLITNLNLLPPPNFPYKSDFQKRYKNDSCTNQLKILVIRDSFGEAMIPFIAECFSESLFIFDDWRIGLNEKIIELYQPDIILFECFETHLDNIIE